MRNKVLLGEDIAQVELWDTGVFIYFKNGNTLECFAGTVIEYTEDTSDNVDNDIE